MTVIINNYIFYSLFSQRGSAGQSSAPATTSQSTLVTQTVKDAFQKQAAYAPSSQKANDLNAAISFFIAKDMMPFQIVERLGFLRMMKTAVPHYKVPSRTFFSKTEIPKLYNQVKADVRKSLTFFLLQQLTCGQAKLGLVYHTSASPFTTSPQTGSLRLSAWKPSSSRTITQLKTSESFLRTCWRSGQ